MALGIVTRLSRPRRGKYLEWPKGVFNVGDIPEKCDNCNVENDYSQRDSLRMIYGQTSS